jgi:hypothetical protein
MNQQRSASGLARAPELTIRFSITDSDGSDRDRLALCMQHGLNELLEVCQ